MNTTAQKLIIPIAIIIAGGLIAAAIFFTQSKPLTKPNVADVLKQGAEVTVTPVTDADHIRGNKDAKIIIVDYSDLECPFCKSFHLTIKRIFDEYGAGNKVAWVYRHFPLDIHKKAPKEAEASECANELGGTDGFWKYIDEVYAVTTSNDTLDLTQLPVIAEKIGLDKAKFITCLDSGKYKEKIDTQYAEARAAGATGTPYTVIIINGESIPLVDEQGRSLGALPYTSFKAVIEQFLK
ncbi:MAG: thioredoxin domain-containing protein [Patescibacteria group bacterium]